MVWVVLGLPRFDLVRRALIAWHEIPKDAEEPKAEPAVAVHLGKMGGFVPAKFLVIDVFRQHVDRAPRRDDRGKAEGVQERQRNAFGRDEFRTL